jgi:hypothetical protein
MLKMHLKKIKIERIIIKGIIKMCGNWHQSKKCASIWKWLPFITQANIRDVGPKSAMNSLTLLSHHVIF